MFPLLVVLLAMKGHGAWYVAMQWGIPPHMRPAERVTGAWVDRRELNRMLGKLAPATW